jgi:hypothetical protein
VLGREVCPVVSFAGRVAVALGGEASSADAVPAWKHKHDKATTTGLIDFIANLHDLGAALRRFSLNASRGRLCPVAAKFEPDLGGHLDLRMFAATFLIPAECP